MDNLRNITPAITEIKTGTRGMKDSSGNYILTGIGGDFIPAGAGGPFDLYKVTAYTPASEGGVVVSGAGTDACNGTYTLQSGTGTSRVWSNGTYEISNSGNWRIATSEGDFYYYHSDSSATDPWSSGTWYVSLGASPAPTVTEGQATEAVLTGVKATAYDTTTKEYTFDTTSTSLSGYEKTPRVNYVFAAKNTNLIGGSIAYAGGIPSAGLYLYAPFIDSSTTAETGQTLTLGDVSFPTVSEQPCCAFNGNGTSRIWVEGTESWEPSSMTASFWYYTNNIQVSYNDMLTKRSGNDAQFQFVIYYGNIMLGSGSSYPSTSVTAIQDAWTHIVFVWNSSNCKIYVNGELKQTYSLGLGSLQSSRITFGGLYDTRESFGGYIHHARLYDRELSEDEISALYAEFA